MSAVTLDGNEAVARVAHRLSEVVAIYPITPASSMGEYCDEWSAAGQTNLWGQVPRIVQLQSEGGAAGTVHGALQAGALTTTFTASQGLLLMLPNLYKIAGELTAFCLHVAARTLATHALSIFCDHSDVMACRGTGFAMLASGSPQEAQDLAAVAHAATLQSRVPFLHFFDGFRTSAAIEKIEPLPDETLRALIDEEAIAAHRGRALSPDHPVLRGAAQNPDTFFQAREACTPFYDACPRHVQATLDRFAALTGRRYHLFDYEGDPEADRVLVVLGSAGETIHETVDWLRTRGQRVGVIKVRLYRPFDVAAFVSVLPKSVRGLAVLDRIKEPGAVGDPLLLDVQAALVEAQAAGLWDEAVPLPRVIGGRYGLSSKEFTPAMVCAIFDELSKPAPRRRFTVGITDDVCGRSLPFDEALDIEPDDVVRAVFFGLGSDGTVGSNKNTIKIIGEETEHFAQGYFVLDSRKAGSYTVSHLRFGPRRIRSAYRIRRASFVACHQPQFLDRYDMAELLQPGGTFLLNAPWPAEAVWSQLPAEVQDILRERQARLFSIDAQRVAEEAGLGRYISSVMQTCFFALSGVLPHDRALERIRQAVQKTYGKRGDEVVRRNLAAIDRTLENLRQIAIPSVADADTQRGHHKPPAVPAAAPDFVQRVTALMIAGHGDRLPVSALPIDGTWPTGTARWERRSLALDLPVWDPAVCIQCNKCAIICPHAAIRTTTLDDAQVRDAPPGFVCVDYKASPGSKYRVQVAPDDCTGCGLCAAFCPAKDKRNPRHKALDMAPAAPLKEAERPRFAFFESLPEPRRVGLHLDVKGSQLLKPLFEFSGACAGCGETPYLKLLSQLFGDRALIANATGCSSIYGGNLPTTPWSQNADGRGPAWSNSLFEDNAEFGLGFRLAVDAQAQRAAMALAQLSSLLGDDLVTALVSAPQDDEAGIAAQRERLQILRSRLASLRPTERTQIDAVAVLSLLADYLVRKSVWIVGGDGWAYDIGYGGLDHVLASGHDVNLLVLDTEVYSNTGGQQSKATPIGAAAKFAAAGKETGKKDLGLLAMTYGNVYVARVALGAKDAQTVRAFQEAESFRGPSLIIAYSHCIAHGYDMVQGAEQQRLAVESGVWPLFRFDPRRIAAGEAPLHLDSPTGNSKVRVREYMQNEGRFRMVELKDPQRYARLVAHAEESAQARLAVYQQLSAIHVPTTSQTGSAVPPRGTPTEQTR